MTILLIKLSLANYISWPAAPIEILFENVYLEKNNIRVVCELKIVHCKYIFLFTFVVKNLAYLTRVPTVDMYCYSINV